MNSLLVALLLASDPGLLISAPPSAVNASGTSTLALTAPSFTSNAANGAYAFGVSNAGAIFCLNGNTSACSDNLTDSSGNMVLTTAAGKNYQLVSGNKLCFDAATCINSIDYNTSNAGYLTLKSNNSGIILSAPTFTPNTLGFNGAGASSFDIIRSNAGSGSFAYRLFNDNSTTAILTISPAGVLTATDGTASHRITATPGATQSVVGGGGDFTVQSGASGNMIANAPTGQNVQLQVNGTAVVTAAGSSVTLAQPTTATSFALGADTTHLAPISTGTTTQEAEEHGNGVTCSTTGTAVTFPTAFKVLTTPTVMVTVVATNATTAFATAISSVTNTAFTVTVGSTTNCGSVMWSAHGDK